MADEHAVAVVRRQQVGVRPFQPQRSGMRAQRVVRHQGAGDQLRLLWRYAFVHVLTVVAVGPAVEAAVLDGGHVVRHQIAAEFVAFVDHGPEPAVRCPSEAVGIAQAARVEAMLATGHIDFPDRGAPLLDRHAVLGHIAVGAGGDVELVAIGAGDEVLGPVMIDLAGRQIDQPGALRGNHVRAGFIGKAHHGIGVGDIEIVAHQRHAER